MTAREEPYASDGHGGDRLSDLVLLTVAAHANENPEDLPPLGASFDPEALNRLLATATNCAVTMTYAGYLVVVTASNTVDVQPIAP